MKERNLLESYLIDVNSYARFKKRRVWKFEAFIGMFFWGGFILLLLKIAFEAMNFIKH
jgi:hypothetical protein